MTQVGSLQTQVLAFRPGNRQIAVVDLDENYVPKGMPTEFDKLPNRLDALEDPRLFHHRGKLYMLAFGFAYKGRPRWQYLARLERSPVAVSVTASTDPAGPTRFRLVQPRRVLLPEDVSSARALRADPDSMFFTKHPEKNWMPFIYNDSIHFIHSMNPLVVLRVLEDLPGAPASADIRTKLVSISGGARIRWRYGQMRGGTPAVYDAALGAYVALFHSVVNFDLNDTSMKDSHRKYYYMGVCVLAPHPPFSIQLMSVMPLVGPRFYNELKTNTHPRRVVFPVGLLVEPDKFIVSYGRTDNSTFVAHFDCRKLLATLQPPLPESWEGPPC